MFQRLETWSILDDAEQTVARDRAEQRADIVADSRAAITRARSLCELAHAQMQTFREMQALSLRERRAALTEWERRLFHLIDER
jgi:hypothetical protein